MPANLKTWTETIDSAIKLRNSLDSPRFTPGQILSKAKEVFEEEKQTLKLKGGHGAIIGKTAGEKLVKSCEDQFKAATKLDLFERPERKYG